MRGKDFVNMGEVGGGGYCAEDYLRRQTKADQSIPRKAMLEGRT